MRWLAGILLLVLLGLQYRLWVGDGSLAQVQALRQEIASEKDELKQLRTRNKVMEAEVQDLRVGLDALEERARSELGMIKQGELFLQVIEETEHSLDAAAPPDKKPEPDQNKSEGNGDLARRDVVPEVGRNP